MPEILLSCGNKVAISEEDEVLIAKKWRINPYGYPVRSTTVKERLNDKVPATYMLHREVMSRALDRLLGSKVIVDHINGDKLDARRENLRLATHNQNTRNSLKSKGATSKFKGVARYRRKGKDQWQSYIYINKRLKCIAIGKDEEQLASLYDLATLYHFGEINKLNFPEEVDRYKQLLEDHGDPLIKTRDYKILLSIRGKTLPLPP